MHDYDQQRALTPSMTPSELKSARRLGQRQMSITIADLKAKLTVAEDNFNASSEALDALTRDPRHYNASGIASQDTPEAAAAHAAVSSARAALRAVNQEIKAAGYRVTYNGQWERI